MNSRGYNLKDLLKEIEEAYAETDVQKTDRERKREFEEFEGIRYLRKHINEFKKDKKFIDSFHSILEQVAVIKTLQYMRNSEKSKIKKTNDHKTVKREIEITRLNNPNTTTKRIIELVADTLSMTQRAVQHHYYNPR